MDIRRFFISVLERFPDNPQAPILLQEAFNSCNQIGELFATKTTPVSAQLHADRLLKDYPINDDYAKDPAFIMALASMLANSLVEWTKETAK